MLEREACSLEQIETAVKDTFGNATVCYRGQSNASWALVPTAFRALDGHWNTESADLTIAAAVERDTYREFDIAQEPHLPGHSFLERLCVAQHHGVPTRLLDWTIAVPVAAFFAASQSFDSDGALWVLNLSSFPFPESLGRQLPDGGFTMERIERFEGRTDPSFGTADSRASSMLDGDPSKSATESAFLMWKPARVDPRLERQSGLLSWCHTFTDGALAWNYSELLTTYEQRAGCDLLLKIIIPSLYKEDMTLRLNRLGVTAHLLFADVDGLGNHLAWLHHRRIRRAYP